MFTVGAAVALLTLTFLEIVLGIDNIIFISIVSNRLPEEQQAKARTIGMLLALFFRIGMLMGISWIIGFTEPVVTILGKGISGRDIILIGGGLFLLAKSTTEIHHKVEGDMHEDVAKTKKASFGNTIAQIVMLDIVFSFDSILTAIGMTDQLLIMILAVIISMVIMIFASAPISSFINKHPSLQILALSFLVMIGVMLIVEAMGYHVPKGYIYFGVFYALAVEMLNMRRNKKVKKA